MSHRGSKAFHQASWERDQRRLGYADGKAGRPGRWADQHYQRGYREGLHRRARS